MRVVTATSPGIIANGEYTFHLTCYNCGGILLGIETRGVKVPHVALPEVVCPCCGNIETVIRSANPEIALLRQIAWNTQVISEQLHRLGDTLYNLTCVVQDGQ